MNLPSDESDERASGRPRIASLVPSLTELAFELGLGPFLVARTGYCVHPSPAVRAVPKVGGTKTVNLDKLRRLAPTQAWVNVDENRLELVQTLRGSGIEPIVTHPLDPEDHPALVDTLVDSLAAWPQVQREARAAGHRLLARIAAALDATRPEGRPLRRVLYLIWREPWMTVARDTYLSRMLARVNWQTWPDLAGGDRGAARYPVVHGTEAWLADVDTVLLSSEPYAFGPDHLAEAQALCPKARVLLVDGEALSWYGPRVLQGLSLLRLLADEPAPPQCPPQPLPLSSP